MSDFTPTENLVRNMKGFMTWRSLNHPTVAKRMETMGFPWYPKTVYRVLAGERPVRLDELYGLALVFETTVGALLDPVTAVPHVSEEAFETGYKIGLMKSIGIMQFHKLLETPEDRLEKAEIAVRSWRSADFVDEVPRWKTWPFSSATQKISAILKTSGWNSVDELLSVHPEGFDIVSNLLKFIADHPNSPEGVPVN